MRTTIRIDDNLLMRAMKRASEEGRTLTSLVEDGLMLILTRAEPDRKRVTLPVSEATGGTLPGIHLNRSSDL